MPPELITRGVVCFQQSILNKIGSDDSLRALPLALPADVLTVSLAAGWSTSPHVRPRVFPLARAARGIFLYTRRLWARELA